MALGCYSGPDPYTVLSQTTTPLEDCVPSGFVVLGQTESQALIDVGLLSNTGLDVDLVLTLADQIPSPALLAEAWGAGLVVGGVPLVAGLVLGSILHFIRKPN